MEKKPTLVVVDFQYDFCLREAPLYVPRSDKALWNISHLIENKKVDRVIFTADWHPANHCSFKRNGGEWNDHCVQFSKGAAIHDLLLYGCIGAGIPYKVITKGTLVNSEEYGIKVAPASRWLRHHTVYSRSVNVDVSPDEQVVVCGLAGDYCVLETLKNLEPIKPMLYLDGVASLDGGVKLTDYIESNNTRLFEL
jgi:nicotinamidase-related amidase